jgi:hypothetical protein
VLFLAEVMEGGGEDNLFIMGLATSVFLYSHELQMSVVVMSLVTL